MEYRKVFDTIPEQFDANRPRYCGELFEALISYAQVENATRVLEIGPGTGQATDPILATGCDYHAIELGEHLYAFMKQKYGDRSNFHIVNDDFITHDFGQEKFDLIYSAATIQWIGEEIAYPKCYELLKPGGVLAMMLTVGDYKRANEELYSEIQKVYDAYFKPQTDYRQAIKPFGYTNAPAYGFTPVEKREFYGKREMNAQQYVAYCGTHSDHITVPEPYKSKFFDGLYDAVKAAGDKIVFEDTYVLFLTKKPQ